jgi:nucleoside diphosphate kinase
VLLLLQPDGVQRGLVGDIIKRFEQRGYTLKGLKLMNVERALAEKHYADLSSKPFFGGLVDYICSGPVVAMVSSAAAAILLCGEVWRRQSNSSKQAWKALVGCCAVHKVKQQLDLL